MQALTMTSHRSNLCDLPVEEQQAIEIDKQRWFKAHQMVRNKPMFMIKEYLESITDVEEREDMRLKLNQTWRNNQNGS